MQQYWFGDFSEGEWIPAKGDDEDMIARLRLLQGKKIPLVPFTDDDISRCALFSNRSDYLYQIRRICIGLAKDLVTEAYQARDQELIHLVHMIDELDQVTGRLGERLFEWYEIRNISFHGRDERQSTRKVVLDLCSCEDLAISGIAREMAHLYDIRRLIAFQVQEVAQIIMPNTSRILGPLVASRIMAAAGGLCKLASLSASTVQVIGSKSALFSHIKTGSPPPKHGILYQHSRVHRAPVQSRGRVSRVIAAKVVIAARIDFYRGEEDEAFLLDADTQINKAGKR